MSERWNAEIVVRSRQSEKTQSLISLLLDAAGERGIDVTIREQVTDEKIAAAAEAIVGTWMSLSAARFEGTPAEFAKHFARAALEAAGRV